MVQYREIRAPEIFRSTFEIIIVVLVAAGLRRIRRFIITIVVTVFIAARISIQVESYYCELVVTHA